MTDHSHGPWKYPPRNHNRITGFRELVDAVTIALFLLCVGGLASAVLYTFWPV